MARFPGTRAIRGVVAIDGQRVTVRCAQGELHLEPDRLVLGAVSYPRGAVLRLAIERIDAGWSLLLHRTDQAVRLEVIEALDGFGVARLNRFLQSWRTGVDIQKTEPAVYANDGAVWAVLDPHPHLAQAALMALFFSGVLGVNHLVLAPAYHHAISPVGEALYVGVMLLTLSIGFPGTLWPRPTVELHAQAGTVTVLTAPRKVIVLSGPLSLPYPTANQLEISGVTDTITVPWSDRWSFLPFRAALIEAGVVLAS